MVMTQTINTYYNILCDTSTDVLALVRNPRQTPPTKEKCLFSLRIGFNCTYALREKNAELNDPNKRYDC